MSIDYYDEHAQEFADATENLDMSELYEPFLKLIPDGGNILDAGCGVGRDALAFLKRGYSVTAFDASAAMCRLASTKTGLPVQLQTFQAISYEHLFDGVWACASLLHVPLSELPDVMNNLERALRRGGVLYCSFKLGTGEKYRNGRLFVDANETLLQALVQTTSFRLTRSWLTSDVRKGRADETWLNALLMADGS